MFLARIARAAARASAASWKRFDWLERAVLALAVPIIEFVIIAFVIIAFVIVPAVSDAVEGYKFNHMSAAGHLKLARAACGIPSGTDAKNCPDPDEAERELQAIPKSAHEYSVASVLLASVLQEQANRVVAAKTYAYEQMQKNVSGQAHDAFICANSTENTPIMSFDGRGSWWKDDGRCAEQLQKKRDEDEQTSSYMSTTLRVDTDIDSSWLPGEERTCQTYPDDQGKVTTVACNSTGSHRDHNIPVKFWGGVNRNTVSNWKCRREGDEFVCRAVD